ncbi:MAG: tyrosine-type recombinase/integrase, partial [Planctomycetota bacterium]
ERYGDHLRARRCAKRTIYCQQLDLNALRKALVADVRSPGEVTLAHLRRYQLGLFNRQLAAATVARVSTHLRMFFRFLFLEELIATDPGDRLEQPRVPPRPPGEVLTSGDVQKLLTAALDSRTPLRDRAVLETLYCTGVRRSELLGIDVCDLDHRERTLLIRAGKGEKPRVLPVAPTCYDALQHYLTFGRPPLEREPSPALFLGVKGRRLCEAGISRLLHDLGERAGIEKRVTPHCFRRTCATGLLKNGTNLKVIQTILGHESLETTSLYLCLSPDEIREEVLTHHPRERFQA